MFVRARLTLVAATCLLVGMFVGAAGTQVRGMKQLVHYLLNSGVFSLASGEAATLWVSLDDDRGQPPARVLMEFYDEHGAAVLSDEVTIQPGASTALRVNGPGLFRAHARVFESSQRLSERRRVVGTVEINDFQATHPPRVLCMIVGQGRIPD